MAWTQDDIDNLRAAIATGARRVRFQGHDTEFRDLDEMKRTLRDMENEINPSAAPPRRTVATYIR